MSKSPSAREQRVFEFICSFKAKHDGNSPTCREIGDGCGISSTSVVRWYLHRLEEKGLIQLAGKKVSRRIQVVGGHWNFSPILAIGNKVEISKGLVAERVN